MFQSKKNVDVHRLLQLGHAHHHHHYHHCQVHLPQHPPHLHSHHPHHLEDHLPIVQQQGDYQHQLPGEGQCPNPTLLLVPAAHNCLVDVGKL